MERVANERSNNYSKNDSNNINAEQMENEWRCTIRTNARENLIKKIVI